MIQRVRERIAFLRRLSVGRILERRVRFRGRRLLTIGDTNSGFWRPGWETVDLIDADHLCDIRKDVFPFPDSSIDVVNASHIIEHLPYPDCSRHFFWFYRVWRVKFRWSW
jgi:hypothetical protein